MGVEVLLLPQTRVQVMFRCGEGSRGQLSELLSVDLVSVQEGNGLVYLHGFGLSVTMKST